MKLLIYSPKKSSRLSYVLDTVFKQFLQLEFQLTTDVSFYQNNTAVKINYSTSGICEEELLIPSSRFLFETGIRPFLPAVLQANSLKALFPVDIPNADFPFDFFSMVFYCLSRYEEYLDFKPDSHGRFPAHQSLASKHHFLNQPLVDLWIRQLAQKLENKYPELQIARPTYRFLPTYDVDLAWAYLHKGSFRSFFSFLKSISLGNFFQIREQVSVSLAKKPDPFYTYDYLDELHKTFNLKPIYFFLLANYGPFDKNVSHRSAALIRLVKSLHDKYTLGIHPSYASNTRPELIQLEKSRLESLTGKKVNHSRQHFLILRFPETYRKLLKYNIENDYSMGYASDIGFRAATSRSFYWYDLEKEESTKLLLHPFQVMDVSLKNYLKLTPEAAIDQLKPMIQMIRQTGGTFTTLWHNSSFSHIENWQNWKAVYEMIIKKALP